MLEQKSQNNLLQVLKGSYREEAEKGRLKGFIPSHQTLNFLVQRQLSPAQKRIKNEWPFVNVSDKIQKLDLSYGRL